MMLITNNKENVPYIYLFKGDSKMNIQQFLIAFILSFTSLFLMGQEPHPQPKTLEINSVAPDFSLMGTDDKIHNLSDFSSSKVLVVVFSCNHCPTAQAYQDRLIDICGTYAQKGVALVVISPNSSKSLNLWEQGWSDLGDELEDMKIRAKDKGYNFPYLYDGGDQKVSIAYGPVATPHAFVFDSSRRLKYAGCIDESMESGNAGTLRNAIDAVLTGKNIGNPITKVFGCSTKWAWKTAETNKLYKQWSELPVTIDNIDAAGIKELILNKSEKLRLINVWASWCGPCVMEFPDFVTIDRIYRSRNFEFISINADKLSRKENVLKFLQKNEASNKNFIFGSDNNTELVEAVDPQWTGALPYTLLVEQGGNVICRLQGPIDMVTMRKLIVNNRYIDGVK
jgi:thiol-disulfide isomerase/thioredoxin